MKKLQSGGGGLDALRAAAKDCRSCPLWEKREIEACYQWLDGEIKSVKPQLIVALGATAAKALLGARFRITKARGEIQRREGLPEVLATYHPSFILRVRSRPEGDEIHRQFVDDLRTAARYLVQDKSDK